MELAARLLGKGLLSPQELLHKLRTEHVALDAEDKVGITKDGRWLKADNIESIADGSWYDSKVTAVISPDTRRELIVFSDAGVERQKVDVIFPVLHGMYGEDGTIQGLRAYRYAAWLNGCICGI